jgi:hypothetical protein
VKGVCVFSKKAQIENFKLKKDVFKIEKSQSGVTGVVTGLDTNKKVAPFY